MNLVSGAGLRLLRFCFLKRIIIRTVSLREQLLQILRRLAGNILYGNTLADVGGVVRTTLRGINVQIPDELVVDDKSLGFVFVRPLRFVHINVVNQLVQHLFGQRPHFHELAYRMDELLPLVFLFAHFGQLPAQLQNLLLQLLTLIGIFLRKNTVVILRGLAAELVLIKRFQQLGNDLNFALVSPVFSADTAHPSNPHTIPQPLHFPETPNSGGYIFLPPLQKIGIPPMKKGKHTHHRR